MRTSKILNLFKMFGSKCLEMKSKVDQIGRSASQTIYHGVGLLPTGLICLVAIYETLCCDLNSISNVENLGHFI